ncbi:MAG: DUF4127 family protein [Armatimonadetes bacterium]|nr:DUF4127 family protein [Armatimonadota bacterium]
MRGVWALVFALAATSALANRILLIPLDSRPATGQFAQMIAKMANVRVEMPPEEVLGRFTDPGDPQAILHWLDDQDYRDIDAVILSTDMVAYGGLIASRTINTSPAEAVQRLHELVRIRRRHYKIPFYAFSAIMRLTPTATREQASFRLLVGKYAEIKQKLEGSKNPADQQSLRNLLAKIPPAELSKYFRIRQRNLSVEKELLELLRENAFDYLVFGQDDARKYGVHVTETAELKRVASSKQVTGKSFFCEGIDQLSNLLVSRALLKRADWSPKVRLIYSDPLAKTKVANYESKPLEKSLSDQLIASGAQSVSPDDENSYDYTLYVNVPKRRPTEFQEFLRQLGDDIGQGFPVAIADVNLGYDGTADPELFDALWKDRKMMKLLSFAGWNTAGNSIGTSIPAANVYLLARRLGTDDLTRELAQKTFLLHRYVNDFAYHKYTRPGAYRLIDASPGVTRDEVYGDAFDEVQDFVRRDLGGYLQRTFNEQFLGQRFYAGGNEQEIFDISNIRIQLPWPRAYEVRLEFDLKCRPAAGASAG